MKEEKRRQLPFIYNQLHHFESHFKGFIINSILKLSSITAPTSELKKTKYLSVNKFDC